MATPQKSTPQESAPQESTPQRSTLQRPHLSMATPQKSTPQKSTPQKSTPQRSTPQRPHHSRSALTLEQKIDVIKSSETLSQRKLAEKFSCGKTQILNILKRKRELMDEWEDNTDSQRKRLCTRPFQVIEDRLWDWFCNARGRGVPVSGPLLQEKALNIAKELNITDFKASNGWLANFKKFHNVICKTVSGEKGDVNMGMYGYAFSLNFSSFLLNKC